VDTVMDEVLKQIKRVEKGRRNPSQQFQNR